MSDPAKRHATIADLLAIPEEHRRHEIIDGTLVEKEAASGRHGGVQLSLGLVLGPYRRRPGGRSPGGWWFASEAEILFEDLQVFRPDVAGWRRENLAELPTEVPITVRPDWICEILSTNKRNDLIYKKRVYQRHGVGHYWIIDPIEETLAVHRWHADGSGEVAIADRTEPLRAEPFEAIALKIGVLFGDDPDE